MRVLRVLAVFSLAMFFSKSSISPRQPSQASSGSHADFLHPKQLMPKCALPRVRVTRVNHNRRSNCTLGPRVRTPDRQIFDKKKCRLLRPLSTDTTAPSDPQRGAPTPAVIRLQKNCRFAPANLQQICSFLHANVHAYLQQICSFLHATFCKTLAARCWNVRHARHLACAFRRRPGPVRCGY